MWMCRFLLTQAQKLRNKSSTDELVVFFVWNTYTRARDAILFYLHTLRSLFILFYAFFWFVHECKNMLCVFIYYFFEQRFVRIVNVLVLIIRSFVFCFFFSLSLFSTLSLSIANYAHSLHYEPQMTKKEKKIKWNSFVKWQQRAEPSCQFAEFEMVKNSIWCSVFELLCQMARHMIHRCHSKIAGALTHTHTARTAKNQSENIKKTDRKQGKKRN